MKKIFLFAVSLFSLNIIHAQGALERPKLVIGIVVDQMRWDYLYRFQERYGDDGLKRLMRDGFNCEQARINYLPSYTAPGHAAIYTGSVPALNGIVANDWIDRRTGKMWYCTEDTSVESVGGGKAGLMSPRNLLATTVGDELRLATNFQARVFGIALKDRAAILPAGHTANAAFWYDKDDGKFISSSYYLKELPGWLRDFNNRKLPDSLMRQEWKTLYPLSTYVQSTTDNNAYEGKMKEDRQPVFPHNTALAVQAKDYGALCYTPQGNTLTRMMAEACISGEKLGQGQTTDFLALSFSATDYIGHLYGPNSIEVEDTYLRLDKEIALFLDYLDKTIGKGKYVLFFTADHGGAHNARFLSDHNIPAKSVSIKAINKRLNAHLEQEFGYASLVRSLMNYQVFLNEPLISSKKLDR
jgi:predicted AlkP superfamily pyrophosphatase or phosphodiesterase